MESRGPSRQDGEFSQEPKGNSYALAVEERDSEGNDLTEDDCSSPSNGKGGRSRCPELVNNNQGVALCDTPSLGLDNEQASDSRLAGLIYLGGYRPRPHHTSTGNINLEEPGLENRDGQSPQHSRRGPFIV